VDIAHYNLLTGEWQISGLGVKLQELYRETFGFVFHGSRNALMHSRRYTLEPLREGPSCLCCDPSAPVQFAELKSVKIEVPAGGIVEFKREAVFETLSANRDWLNFARFVDATLSLKCSNRRRRVMIKICPERDTINGTAAEPAIDSWLNERGFAHHDGQLLASA
jgi:hypothetical protein